MRLIFVVLLVALTGCSVLPRTPDPVPKPAPAVAPPPQLEVRRVPPKIALALGGGAARGMGADLVIAVYISNNPRFGKTRDSVDVMLQSFAIMGQSIAGFELTEADIVIRPDTGAMHGTDFDNRHQAIIEGEKAGLAAIAAIKLKVAEKTLTVATNR